VSIRGISVPDFFGYDSFEVHFAVDLLAWDPIRYGDESDASSGLPTQGGGLEFPLFGGGAGGALYFGANGGLGRVTLANSGTADTWPVFSVVGQLDGGFRIQRLDTGDVLEYSALVPAGSMVSIDTATGEVLIDGVSDGSGHLTRSDFFALPAMSSIDVQFNAITTSSGTPTMTAQTRSGWW